MVQQSDSCLVSDDHSDSFSECDIPCLVETEKSTVVGGDLFGAKIA
jgi:hypothetical protein